MGDGWDTVDEMLGLGCFFFFFFFSFSIRWPKAAVIDGNGERVIRDYGIRKVGGDGL